MPSALILIADGTEEMEFTIVYDTLVRAGVSCTSAFVHDTNTTVTTSTVSPAVGTTPPLATGSRGIVIRPDVHFDPAHSGPDTFDALVIPGGMTGAETLSQSESVQHLVRQYLDQNHVVGSLAALTANLPAHTTLTSHPSVRVHLEQKFNYSEDSVVVFGTLVTSRGPGTAFLFAFTLVELLCGPEKREEVRSPMVFPPGTPF